VSGRVTDATVHPAGRESSTLLRSKGGSMNLTISGHHLEVTPALREYVLTKLDRVTRHFDQVVDISVLLTVEKQKEKDRRQKAEVNLHVKGRTSSLKPPTRTCTPPLINWSTNWTARSVATRTRCRITTTRPSSARMPSWTLHEKFTLMPQA
jgi:hypothetical protein